MPGSQGHPGSANKRVSAAELGPDYSAQVKFPHGSVIASLLTFVYRDEYQAAVFLDEIWNQIFKTDFNVRWFQDEAIKFMDRLEYKPAVRRLIFFGSRSGPS